MTVRSWLVGLAALVLVLGAPPAWAGTAQVQHCVAATNAAGCTFPSSTNITTGNLVAVYVAWEDTTDTLTSVTDTINAYTIVNGELSESQDWWRSEYRRRLCEERHGRHRHDHREFFEQYE
jgi:hypothetical protein